MNIFIGRKYIKLLRFVKNHQYLSILIGIFLLFISPFIFTLNSFWNKLDFSKTGQIGDTIGGITSPFISILGAILVYLSFKEQIKANKIQIEYIKSEKKEQTTNKNFNLILSLIKDFLFDFENLSYVPYSGGSIQKEGQLAVSAFVKDFETKTYRFDNSFYHISIFFNDYYYALKHFLFICDKVNRLELEKSDEELIKLKIYLIFHSKLYENLIKTYSIKCQPDSKDIYFSQATNIFNVTEDILDKLKDIIDKEL